MVLLKVNVILKTTAKQIRMIFDFYFVADKHEVGQKTKGNVPLNLSQVKGRGKNS